ncbi:unnamed protein product [Sphagnum troendelagicum]|uniref:Tetratricopeptide repeat-like superfamily protein n=1 Tax=Sphagnum troendelagicum TaxID=128251 RepID=A0ABP0U0B5_9BRYO
MSQELNSILVRSCCGVVALSPRFVLQAASARVYGARGVALKLCCRNSLDLSASGRGWNRWGVQNWQGKKHDATRTRHVLVRADYGGRHGFGTQPAKKSKKGSRTQRRKQEQDPILQAQQILQEKQKHNREDLPSTVAGPAPTLAAEASEELFEDVKDEKSFEEQLEVIKRSAKEQKALQEAKKYGPIDYDSPPPAPQQSSWTDNITTKIGIGVAILVFGAIFAFGDFLPSGSPGQDSSKTLEQKKLPPEEAAKLKVQAQGFEDTLKSTPEDQASLEGAGVTYAELGEYDKAVTYLTKLVQKVPNDVEAQRLLGEVQYEAGNYEASATAYRSSIRASPKESLQLQQGLISALLADKKPSEAVGELLAVKGRLKESNQQKMTVQKSTIVEGKLETGPDVKRNDDEIIDPVQVELLLGKAYSEWGGHSGDAVAVYDGLISSHPDDFRGYLAKGILLKDQGKASDAERMFIQARYLAPGKAKALVDQYKGR